MNTKVDKFLDEVKQWQDALTVLRTIVLECDLQEELKWGQPCYTNDSTNLIILGGFKAFCFVSFINGALLADDQKLLEKPGENTQAGRMMKFTNVQDIIKHKDIIKSYIFEAIEVQRLGIKLEKPDNATLIYPDELAPIFANNPSFKTAFEALTPGRQRAYNMHWSSAKQATTRIDRIEKYIPRIMDGKGINDCTCGFSKRMPNCDGSHKYI